MEAVIFNYLAVISAAVASFILGGIYVALFSKQSAKLNGFTEAEAKEKQKANPKGLVGIFLANLAMAFGVSYLIFALDVHSIVRVLSLEFWLFVGFVGPMSIGPVLWEGKSIKLWIFNNIINVIALFAMMLILTFWR
ncbi:MAG TPA: DUF1761 domain-containing protein [Candidatus Udaeobacter sp.]|nr:DUF1761 domain-containing protein [Candidatus Udaeobacter sp.]